MTPTRRSIIEPFKIKVVEPLPMRTVTEREQILAAADYNLFGIHAADVSFDFLTDSGTTAMSAAQWGGMMVADESYAGSRSFYRFEEVVRRITGYHHVIPTHQGRAAEHLVFSLHCKAGQLVPSNNHFDTTRANLEQLGVEAVDLVCAEGKDPTTEHPFKGNVDVARLEAFLLEHRGRVPFVMTTITNNTGGGQPVSLGNLRAVSAVCRRAGVPFLLDACRFAENAWFIKVREPGQQDRSPRDIARDVFDLADGCLVSAKKDGLVNIGGFIALRDGAWVPDLRSRLILTEGFPTYGGLAARDLEAIAIGLDEVLDESYLAYREGVIRYLADGCARAGVPTMRPPGGHAVYLDARALLPHVPPHEFPAQALAVELYRAEGVRSCEIGSVMFGQRPDGGFQPAAMELVRLAIPRRVYTQAHFDYVLEGIAEIAARRDQLGGLRIIEQPAFLRHFTARFAPIAR
ncbi:MAG: tyrosine phenol-lyase [Deltaproteobacteria bacterium]|nr:tyrosine phenol-lyase [Deltaproteobacteria bacterium]